MIQADSIAALWLALIGAGHDPTRLSGLMSREHDTAPWYFYFQDGYDGPRVGRVTHEFTHTQQISDEMDVCRALIDAENLAPPILSPKPDAEKA